MGNSKSIEMKLFYFLKGVIKAIYDDYAEEIETVVMTALLLGIVTAGVTAVAGAGTESVIAAAAAGVFAILLLGIVIAGVTAVAAQTVVLLKLVVLLSKIILYVLKETTPYKKTTVTTSKSIFQYLFPSKRREEIMGDLTETEFQLVKAGFPKWKIKLVMCWHKWWVLIGVLRIRLSDFGVKKEKSK